MVALSRGNESRKGVPETSPGDAGKRPEMIRESCLKLIARITDYIIVLFPFYLATTYRR